MITVEVAYKIPRFLTDTPLDNFIEEVAKFHGGVWFSSIKGDFTKQHSFDFEHSFQAQRFIRALKEHNIDAAVADA